MDVATWRAEILSARPDYRAAMLSKKLADISYQASLGAFLPSVKGTLAYTYDERGNNGSLNDYNFTAIQLGLNVAIPIFTGGYRSSLMASAKIQQSEANEQIQKKRDEIQRLLDAIP